MQRLNNYILEKLKINKDTKISGNQKLIEEIITFSNLEEYFSKEQWKELSNEITLCIKEWIEQYDVEDVEIFTKGRYLLDKLNIRKDTYYFYHIDERKYDQIIDKYYLKNGCWEIFTYDRGIDLQIHVHSKALFISFGKNYKVSGTYSDKIIFVKK